MRRGPLRGGPVHGGWSVVYAWQLGPWSVPSPTLPPADMHDPLPAYATGKYCDACETTLNNKFPANRCVRCLPNYGMDSSKKCNVLLGTATTGLVACRTSSMNAGCAGEGRRASKLPGLGVEEKQAGSLVLCMLLWRPAQHPLRQQVASRGRPPPLPGCWAGEAVCLPRRAAMHLPTCSRPAPPPRPQSATLTAPAAAAPLRGQCSCPRPLSGWMLAIQRLR